MTASHPEQAKHTRSTGCGAGRQNLSLGVPDAIYFACLVQVPLSCDLGQVVKQLAHLGCWDGLLDLPLRRAAAVDPEVAARLPGEAGRAAREVHLLMQYMGLLWKITEGLWKPLCR